MKKEDAISYFGSAAELARNLNISEPRYLAGETQFRKAVPTKSKF